MGKIQPYLGIILVPRTLPKGEPRDLECEFRTNLPLILDIVNFIAKKNCLSTDEASDFRSEVHLKLIENDYEVLAKFEGRSSIKTYFHVVLSRLFLDYRFKLWGKWRPSEAAKRLGTVAILLERYTHADGYTFQQAAQFLRQNHQIKAEEKELYALYESLPHRQKRMMVSDDILASKADDESLQEEHLIQREEQLKLEQAISVMNVCLGKLGVEDRTIIKMHFHQKLPLSKVAKALGLNQKKLYRRMAKILNQLAQLLKEHGIDEAQIKSLLQ